MKSFGAFLKIPSTIFMTFILVVVTPGIAYAHVTVKPHEVTTATYQVFTVNVPNEKNIPTVSVKILLPKEIPQVTPTHKTGWTVNVEKQDNKEDAVATSITWSNGEISEGLRDEFTFSAKTPDKDTELQWKAYQTYADGTVVSWDQKESEGHHGDSTDSGPYSTTHVTKKAVSENSQSSVSQESVADAKINADRAIYIATAGVVLGLVAIFLATRKK